jgi:adenylate cyclase class 2
MQNVECKYELRDLELCRLALASLKASKIATMQQTDTYFKLADGRLKKRESVADGVAQPVEFIFYHRENQAKARVSRFTIYSVAEAAQYFGSTEPPVWVTVKKTRELYMLGGVRIHVDDVEGLGRFVEFEALVSPSNNLVKSYDAVHQLQEALGPALGGPLSQSYSDMLAGDAAG